MGARYARAMIYEPNQCPVRFGLGVFGDRWSLLIIRDLMFRGFTRFQQFLDGGEGISTNVLSDRLRRLESQHVITRKKDPENGRQVIYELTQKGRDLAPVMLSIWAWAEQHDPDTHVSHDFAERIRNEFSTVRDELLHTLSPTDPDV